MHDIVFTNEFMTLYQIDVENPYVMHAEWKSFWAEETIELKEALDLSLSFIKEKKPKIIISDCTELETIAAPVLENLEERWYPTAYQMGLLVEILIEAEDFMGMVSLETLKIGVNESKTIEVLKVHNLKEAFDYAPQVLEKINELAK